MAETTTSITPGLRKKATVTFAEVTANSDSAAINITVSGAKVGMIPLISWGAAFEAGILVKQQPFVSAADTVTAYLRNETGGNITPAAQTAYIVVL